MNLPDRTNTAGEEGEGYCHSLYALSLGEFGNPIRLPRSGGWILQRSIAGSDRLDAMGCYPFYCCADWAALGEDIRHLPCEWASLAIVTDPFGGFDLDDLRAGFNYVLRPFKQHFVIELGRAPTAFVSSHHQRNARKALQVLRVSRCDRPIEWHGEWVRLYDVLIARHRISGITGFSARAFALQLQVPGLVMFRAEYAGATVGMTLWYVQGEQAYYHLGAYSNVGYEHNASFALFWTAIEYFSAKGLHWMGLGAGAGATARSDDGLSRFKRGWATDRRDVYFCGKILNRELYDRLVQHTRTDDTAFFPAYRAETAPKDSLLQVKG